MAVNFPTFVGVMEALITAAPTASGPIIGPQ
jgi:hypothetical protein